MVRLYSHTYKSGTTKMAVETKYYKSFTKESIVDDICPLFQDLSNKEIVTATISCGEGEGVTYECIMDVHNYLDRSKIWKKTTPWITEVEYTIPHPGGNITAFDTSVQQAQLSRKSAIASVTGRSGNNTWNVSVTRVLTHAFDKMDFNASRFSWVRVMNTKRFYYETKKSCWVFRLVVCWEGDTKQMAKAGGKKYFINVETIDHVKSSANPRYSAASILEKILDLISLEGTRQTLIF